MNLCRWSASKYVKAIDSKHKIYQEKICRTMKDRYRARTLWKGMDPMSQEFAGVLGYSHETT